MSDFESCECATCDSEFGAHPSARAAQNGYCSPSSESDGRGLA